MAGVSAEQRRLNLMIALSSTRRRLTREEIRAKVDGYDAPDARATPEERERAEAAFQRMFERDKDELRRMGLPLRTVVDPLHQDDLGYRIDGETAMPDLDLTVQDAAVLALAVEYWQGADLAADARLGFAKVMSAIEHGDSAELPYGGMATTAAQSATAELAEAVVDRQVVRFDYASASSAPGTRTVQPWGIVMRAGVEYLIAWDLDREAERTFRLGRIMGKVKRIGDPEAFERPKELPMGALNDSAPEQTARVAVRPEAGHHLRRRGTVVGDDDGWDVLEVPYRHADLLRSEVLALGGAAKVLEPASVADAIREYAAVAQEVCDG